MVLVCFGVVIDKSDSTSRAKGLWQALRWEVGTIIICIYTDWSQVAGPQRMAIELQHWQKTVVTIVLGCADDQTRSTRSEFHDPRPAKTRSSGNFRVWKTRCCRLLIRSRGWTKNCGWICSEVRSHTMSSMLKRAGRILSLIETYHLHVNDSQRAILA